MRYLAQVNYVPDHWYPSEANCCAQLCLRLFYQHMRCAFSLLLLWSPGDPQECARVNSALDWYHGNVRLPAIMLTWYVIAQTMQPTFKPISVSEQAARRQLAVLKNTLKVIYTATLFTNAHMVLRYNIVIPFQRSHTIMIAHCLMTCSAQHHVT